MTHVHARKKVRGLTLVELVLALGLLALLMVGLIQLLDRSLSLWRRGETQRSLTEQGAILADLMAEDLRGIEGGEPGDLLAEWVRFDTDGDGIAEAKWPRLRMVRALSAADTERVLARSSPPERGKFEKSAPSAALSEVIWLVAPASVRDREARAEGRLWRGERLTSDARTKSFFAPDFMGTSNQPPGGVTDEVSDGVLWLAWMFATPTSVVHDAWELGTDARDAATAWDAWSLGRPDREAHPYNAPRADEPAGGAQTERPRLPRRVRIEIELERASDRARRTFLSEAAEQGDAALVVDDASRLPRSEEAFVLVDAEWMRLGAIDGDRAAITRAERGTQRARHEKGAMVHYGFRHVRDVRLAAAREEWKP